MTEFVLVHGTIQSPAGWDRLAAVLRARGDQVTTIDLPAGQPDWAVAGYARAAGRGTARTCPSPRPWPACWTRSEADRGPGAQ